MKNYIFLLLICSSAVFANIGEVTALRGNADLFRDGKRKSVEKGLKLKEHDRIKTAANSKLQVIFKDKTVISLGQKSELIVDEYLYNDKDKKAKFSITKGFFKSITGKIGKLAPKHFKVKTSNATIGVRGTTIIGETSKKLDIIACSRGQIEVVSEKGSVIVNQGERTIVAQAKAPAKAQKVNMIILKQLDKKSDPTSIETKASSQTKNINNEQIKENVSKKKTQAKQEEKSTILTEETISRRADLSDIQKVLGTQTPVYEGKITQGSTSFGDIKLDGVNKVNLGFDLGAATMDGNMKFEDPIKRHDISVEGKVKDDGTFNFNSVNGYDGGGKGKIEANGYKKANAKIDFEEKDLFTQKSNFIKAKLETTLKE